MSLKIGSYIWTASGAGWISIGLITGVELSYLVGLGCLIMAYIFGALHEDSK